MEVRLKLFPLVKALPKTEHHGVSRCQPEVVYKRVLKITVSGTVQSRTRQGTIQRSVSFSTMKMPLRIILPLKIRKIILHC